MKEILRDFPINIGNEDNVSLIRKSLAYDRKTEGKISEIKKELDTILKPNICPLNNNLNKKTVNDFIEFSNFGVAIIDFFGNIESSNDIFNQKISSYLNGQGQIDMDNIKDIEREFNVYKLGEPSFNENSLSSLLITESENKQLLDILVNLESIIFELASKSSIDGIIRTLYNRLSELVPIDRISFVNLYCEEDKMKAESFISFDTYGEIPIPDKKGKEISQNSNLYSLISNKEFRLIEDMEKWKDENNIDSEFTNRLIKSGYKSSMTFPLFGKDGTPIGILFLNSTQKHAYEEKHLNILRQLISYVKSNVENIKNYEKINEESKRDGLTGLYNRQEFERVKENLIPIEFYEAYEEGRQKEYSLIFFDIDYFKSLNDKFGHTLGDDVLKRIGDLLKSIPFLGEHGRVFRVGGEEFAIIVDSKDINSLKQFITDLQDRINTIDIFVDGDNKYEAINISASFGVVTFNNEGVVENNTTKIFIEKNMSEIYNLADNLLYMSKDNGRNQCNIFSEKVTTMSPYGLKILYNGEHISLSEFACCENLSETIKGRYLSSQEVLKEVFLKNIELFDDIDEEILYELSKYFYLEYFNEGDSIIEKGANAKKVFILKEGTLKVQIGNEKLEQADKYIDPGALIGEMAFLENGTHSNTVRAVKNCSMWSIDINDFEYVVNKNKILLDRLKELKQKREEENKDLLREGSFN